MRERVLAVLKAACPEIDFESSNELVDDGVLDSLSLVAIISELSMEFEIIIPFEQILPERFNSIDEITKLVQEYI